MLKTLIFTLAALVVVLMSNVQTGRAQTNPLGDNNFIVWYHDWFQDFQFDEIRSCSFNSDESILAVLSYSSSEYGHNLYRGFISLFDVNTGNLLDSIFIYNETTSDNIVFYNDSTVIIDANNFIRFYNLRTKQMVREIDYLKKNYPTRNISEISITKDKRYLSVSTVQDFFVFDLLTDSVLMKRSIPDMDFFNDPYYNSYVSNKFLDKKNTLLVVHGANLLEFDYKKDTLLNTNYLGCHPEYGNLDVSDSEDMLTYAAWSEEIANYAYIFNLETKKFQKIQVAGVDTLLTWVNFFFKDRFLQLDLTFDPYITRFYDIFEKKSIDKNFPRFTKRNLRSKFSNKILVFDSPAIALVDGDAFITDIPQDDTKVEVLIHPNPGTNQISIDVNLSSMGFYKLKISNVEGNIIKSQDYGYLESGKNQLVLNISDLLSGVYFLNLTNGTHNYNFKLVKE